MVTTSHMSNAMSTLKVFFLAAGNHKDISYKLSFIYDTLFCLYAALESTKVQIQLTEFKAAANVLFCCLP